MDLGCLPKKFKKKTRGPQQPRAAFAKVPKPKAASVVSTTGRGELRNGFHGDPSRGNKFWIYPKRQRLVTPRWDTHLTPQEFCSNCIRWGRGSSEWICLGHFGEAQNKPVPRGPGTGDRDIPFERRRLDISVEEWWACDPRGYGPKEYRAAQDMIAVHPSLMCASQLQDLLKNLDDALATQPFKESFETTVLAAITAVFRTPENARNFNARDYYLNIDFVGSGVAFEGCLNTFNQLTTWHRPYLQGALGLLTRAVTQRSSASASADGKNPIETICSTTAASDSLRLVLGYLVRGSQECQARKQWAFVQALTSAAGVLEQNAAASSSKNPRDVLVKFVHRIIDGDKDSAFKTVFLEPTLAFARSRHDSMMEGDVEVHGANAYLAILLATLGVRLARQPLLNDGIKAVVNFIDAADPQQLLGLLWQPENFGRSVHGLKKRDVKWERIQSLSKPRPRLPVRKHEFFFPDVATALELAERSVSASSHPTQRAALAVCLEQFACYFSHTTIVPRLIKAIAADEHALPAADVLCAELHSEGVLCASTLNECAWCCVDEDTYEYAFNMRQASVFLQRLGVLKA